MDVNLGNSTNRMVNGCQEHRIRRRKLLLLPFLWTRIQCMIKLPWLRDKEGNSVHANIRFPYLFAVHSLYSLLLAPSVTLQYIYTHIQLFNPSTPRGMEFSLNHHQDTSIYRSEYRLFLAEGSTSEGISSQQSLQPPLSVRSKGKSCSKALITSWPWIDEKNFDWTAPPYFY